MSYRYNNIDESVYAIVGALYLLGHITVMVLYLLSVQRTLESVSPENRKMSPGMVWLCMIPVFGLAWTFVHVIHTSDSIGAEYRRRNWMMSTDRPAYGIGIAYAILAVCCYIPLPFFRGLVGIACLVCFIIHWVSLVRYTRMLTGLSPAPGQVFQPQFQQNFEQGFEQQQQYAQGSQQQWNNNQQQWNNNPQWNNPNQQQWNNNLQWNNPNQQQWNNPPQNNPQQQNDSQWMPPQTDLNRWAPPSDEKLKDEGSAPPKDWSNDNYQK